MDFWPEVGAKLLVYGALLMLVGALGLRWLLLPRAELAIEASSATATSAAVAEAPAADVASAADRLALRCVGVLIVALFLRAAAHTVAAFGPADAWHWENLTLVALESQWGLQWQQQMLVALALAATTSLGLWHPIGRMATVVATLVFCFVLPNLGHAAGASDRAAVHGVHIVAAGLWLGTLGAIVSLRAASIRHVRPQLLRAFAPVAMGSVAILAASGAFAAWSYLGPLSNVWTTTYGRLLGLKLLLVLDALCIGGFNWVQIHRRGRSPNPALVTAEAVLAVAIVAVTAWLTETAHP